MPASLHSRISSLTASAAEQLKRATTDLLHGPIGPGAVREFELRLQAITRSLASKSEAATLHHLFTRTDLDRLAVRAFQDTHAGFRDKGPRPVKIHLPDDSVVEVCASYLRPQKRRRRGAPKRKRGAYGKGRWPALEALGIHVVHGKLKATPLVQDRLIWALTACDSHEAAREALSMLGLDWSETRVQSFLERAGEDYLEQRTQWLEQLGEQGPIDPADFKGKRVVVSVDGGRVRLRCDRPGRPLKSGYHRFDAPWREPRLMCIYVVDEQGHRDRSVRSVIDGVMEVFEDEEDKVAADRLFELVGQYARALRLEEAAEVMVVADGADWIWNRARNTLEAAGVEKLTEVVDFYHVSEHICELAKKAGWSAPKRISWRNRMLGALSKSQTSRLEQLMGKLEGTPAAGSVYLSKHTERIDYAGFRERGVVCGSGAVESAIRRVINLRLKGNAKYWKLENVRVMLMWRGYLAAGRLEELTQWSRGFRARWWLECEQRAAQQAIRLAA